MNMSVSELGWSGNVAKSGVECGIFHTHLQNKFEALQKVLKSCRMFESINDTIFVGFEICTLIDDHVPDS